MEEPPAWQQLCVNKQEAKRLEVGRPRLKLQLCHFLPDT